MRARRAARDGRVRTFWDDMPLMRSFFLYAAGCVLTSIVVSIALMIGIMSVYDTFQRSVWEGRVDVEGGPYVYDAETDELVPAVAIELASAGEAPDRIAFLGMRDQADGGLLVGNSPGGVINADTGAPVGYATLEMVCTDPSLTVYDWGGNYTVEDYEESDGSPYDLAAIDESSLAAYDARERSERMPVTGPIARLGDGDEAFVVSNIGYFVSQDAMAYETPFMVALRIATGLTPFVVLGVASYLFFRRFYRKRLAGPLDVICACADRVGQQDLDFVTPGVPGREFTKLGDAFEKMRVSLEASQRELWRIVEDHRRLNAAFAHDLRTPITVLKGTVEMAELREEHGEPVDRQTVATITEQVERLESYTMAMSGIAKLDDRPVVREPLGAGDFSREMVRYMQEYVGAKRPALALAVDAAAMPRTGTIDVDRALVEEVLGNVLGNACEHARSRVAVSLSCDVSAGRLSVRVVDDGPGFTPEALHRGCDPFYGEAKSAKHFGLGLNIVQTLARLHGGDVSLANDAAGGACVTVTFHVAA